MRQAAPGTEFLATSGSYLAAIAPAATIHLAGFAPDPHSVLAMRAAIGNAAVLHDDALLFDVRPGGERRSFRLRLAVLLLKCNIGAVGIIQEAADEVHNTVVNEFPLEVLPASQSIPECGRQGQARADLGRDTDPQRKVQVVGGCLLLVTFQSCSRWGW